MLKVNLANDKGNKVKYHLERDRHFKYASVSNVAYENKTPCMIIFISFIL